MSDLLRVLSSSVRIADRAGQIVRDIMSGGQLGIVEKTGKNDLQTEADRSEQNCIVASLQAQYPDLKVVGEEGEQDLSKVPTEWVVKDFEEKVLAMKYNDEIKNAKIENLTV